MFFLFGWFFLCFFSPHIPHVVMYFFCHLLPVWLLHLIFSVALPAVLKCSSGISQVSNAVQPVCVLLANEQMFFPCFLMLFYTDTITLSQFGLLPPPPVWYQIQILVYSVWLQRNLHLPGSAFLKIKNNLQIFYFLPFFNDSFSDSSSVLSLSCFHIWWKLFLVSTHSV